LKSSLAGRWDISSAGHIEAGKSPLEAAHAEVAEELGIDLKSTHIFNRGLQHAFVIPAEQAPLGGCNAYEHVYFLHLNENSELKLSLGTEEVTEVTWMDSAKLIESLRSGDDNFAPRSKQYVVAMEKYINTMNVKGMID
jgi:8-oxo-dGTP diphosphatase